MFSKSSMDGTFDTSHTAWLALKGERGDSYCYSTFTSSWTGASSKTVIHVGAGAVTSRQYRFDPGNNGVGSDKTWIEDAASLGAHAAGAPPRTIDGLYDDCKSDILSLDPATNTVFFQVDPQNGVMRNCQGWSNACADDCSSGPQLEELVFTL